MTTSSVKPYLLSLQQRIVDALEQIDGKPFLRDEWQRAPGESPIAGGGITCILEQGNVLERGGVTSITADGTLVLNGAITGTADIELFGVGVIQNSGTTVNAGPGTILVDGGDAAITLLGTLQTTNN
ncbi:MAG TPA: coproporphyrinogen III oxidase, partial [Noviherbaspirillum sp.]